MRIESALYASREGLQAHGQAIAVVGDNISNSNTVGYKGARTEFSDLLDVGSGVQVGRVRHDTRVGVVEQTGRALDAAIAGNGYFVVGDAEEQFYSRAGNFSLDTQGRLVDASGKTVLGFLPNSEALSEINLFNINTTGAATSAVTVNGNLLSQEDVGVAPNNPASFEDLERAATYLGSMRVYDSLGAPRDITLAYTKTGAGVWTAQAYIDGGEVGQTEGVPVQVGGNATLTFGPTGVIAAGDQAAAVITGTPAYGGGAAAGNFTINLAQMTQYATGSQLTGVAQDGRSSGNVKDFRFDSDGSLYAVLDSGTESLVARLPVATFRNNDGLERIGGNLFAASDMAGERTLNIAGEGISGAIEGSSLERSTVDLAAQFVDLVLFQRGYQASSQTLSAANELIQATIQLIR